MHPLVTSALISGGSQILGGLFGGGGNSNKRASRLAVEAEMRALQNQETLDKNRFSWITEGAQKAGIHPLAAMGMQPVSLSPTPVFGDSGGSDKFGAIADMGQGISRAVTAWTSKEERQMAAQSAALQLENQQLQNDRLRSEISLMNTGGTPGITAGPHMPGQGDGRYLPQELLPLGYGDDAPFLRMGIDSKGNRLRVYNDELGDNEILQAMTSLGYTIPDWLHGNVTKPIARRVRGARQKIRERFKSGWR